MVARMFNAMLFVLAACSAGHAVEEANASCDAASQLQIRSGEHKTEDKHSREKENESPWCYHHQPCSKIITLCKINNQCCDRAKRCALSPNRPNSCVKDIAKLQDKWANLILDISDTYFANGDFVAVAEAGISKLYGYDDPGKVLFKPTKAAEYQFRPTSEGALSYFVGYDAIKPAPCCSEDGGFALGPAGNGWSAVQFENNQTMCIGSKLALAQGNYFFTDATNGDVAKVEYTFVYQKVKKNTWKIIVHHSSLPYSPPTGLLQVKTPPAVQALQHASHYGPPEQGELYNILQAQEVWGNLILNISDTYFANGDFVAVAEAGISELYGYNDPGKVLFKPTKAAEYQFRPTSEGALSYFVGYDAIKPAPCCSEDGGFAINAGNGWSAVKFENNQTMTIGAVNLAQGNYFFTDATNGDVVKVEYTFVYEEIKQWPNMKIVVHHSSVPYNPTVLLSQINQWFPKPKREVS